MIDYRRAVAFADGRQVTFNAAAPTITQSVLGAITRYRLLGTGISGCTIVWGIRKYRPVIEVVIDKA
jgi:hypothetical protein